MRSIPVMRWVGIIIDAEVRGHVLSLRSDQMSLRCEKRCLRLGSELPACRRILRRADQQHPDERYLQAYVHGVLGRWVQHGHLICEYAVN